MQRTTFISNLRSLLAVLAILATSVVGAIAATPSAAGAVSCDCVKYRPALDGTPIADRDIYVDMNWVNDSDRYWTDNRVSVTFPAGVEFEWSTLNDANYDPATRTVTGTPAFWGVGYPSNILSPWEQSTPYLRVHIDASLEGQSVTIRSTANFTSDEGIPGGIINSVTFEVLPKPDDFDYRTETRFTPDSADYGDTTTLISSVYNDGPGKGGDVYAEIYFDGALTLTSDLPDGCTDYGIGDSSGLRNIDCEQYVPDGGSDPGLVASWSFTLQIPDAPVSASVDSETFEASTQLGCNTSGSGGNDEIDEDNNSDSTILTVPPSPVGLLAVVRNLPASIDQPGVITNPTAGRSMSSSVDVFNAGDATIGGPITVTIAPMAGFTPTSISATSEDSATPAPSCVLATLTCTFTQLGDGLRARIVIVGDLAPTIADGTQFSSTVTASAAGFDSASDTDTTTISALAEGTIAISSVTNASPGEQVTYGVTVTNGGPSTMADPVVTLTLPAGVTVVELPDICTQRGDTLICTLPASLDPEETYSFGFTAGLPDEVGDFQVTATLSSATPLADASVTDADHLVATASTVTDLVEEGALPYTGSNSGTLVLVGAGLALSGLMLVSATGMVATRRRND